MTRNSLSALLAALFSCVVFSTSACRPVPTVKRAVGSHSLSGRVIDMEGNGLAGVLVRVNQYERSPVALDSSTLGGPVPSLDYETARSKADERYARDRARTYEAVSDETGAYRIDGLVDARYGLQAYKRDFWIPSPKGGSVTVAGNVVDLTARPVVPIRISVLMPDGEEAEEAVIVFGDKSLPRLRLGPFAWNAKDPFVRVPIGELKMRAVRGAFGNSSWTDHEKADFSSTSKNVHVPADGLKEPLVLRFKGQMGIRGRVSVGQNSEVFWSMGVYMLRLEDGQAVDLDVLQYSGKHLSINPTRDFTFTGLGPGRYMLGLSRDRDGQIETHHVVEVRGGFAEQNLVLPPPKPVRCLLADVRGPAGESVSGAELFFLHDTGRGTRASRSLKPLRYEEGLACIEIPVSSRNAYYGRDGDGHEFRLVAKHEEFGAVELQLQAGQSEAVITFGEPAQLTIELPGFQECSRKERLCLLLSPLGDHRDPLWRYRGVNAESVGDSGVVVLNGIVSGSYKLTLLLRNEGATGRSGRMLVVSELELVAGENQTIAAVPPLCNLKVTVAHGAGAELELKYLAPGAEPGGRMYVRAKATCDDEGIARFTDIVAGTYRVSASLRTELTEVEVDLGELDLQRPNQEASGEIPELCSFGVQMNVGGGQRIALQQDYPRTEGVKVRRHQFQAESDASGVARFEDVPAGMYELVLLYERGAEGLQAFMPKLEVHPELKVVSMPIPETHDFVFKVAKPPGADEESGPYDPEFFSGKSLWLSPVEEGPVIYDYSRCAFINSEGLANFNAIPAGSYVVLAGGMNSPFSDVFGKYKNRVEITIPSTDLAVDWLELTEQFPPETHDFSVRVLNGPTDLKITMISTLTKQLQKIFSPYPQSQPDPRLPDEVDAAGRAHFRGVIAGSYVLSIGASAGAMKTLNVSVPAGDLTVEWSELQTQQ